MSKKYLPKTLNINLKKTVLEALNEALAEAIILHQSGAKVLCVLNMPSTVDFQSEPVSRLRELYPNMLVVINSKLEFASNHLGLITSEARSKAEDHKLMGELTHVVVGDISQYVGSLSPMSYSARFKDLDVRFFSSAKVKEWHKYFIGVEYG